MERNHIIGFVLIFGLLVVWTFVNSPSKEEMAAMQERQDSLNRVEIIKDSIATEAVSAETATLQPDSTTLANKYGTFANAAAGAGENKTITLDNQYFSVSFDTRGGKISNVELKDYKKVLVDDQKKEYKIPLRLLEDPRNIWDVTVPSIRGDLHTADLHFEPTVSGNKITFTATGETGEQIIQEYTLTDKPYEIQYQFAIQNGASLINQGGANAKLTWVNQLDKIERSANFERSMSTVYFKESAESVDYCNCRGSEQENLGEKPIKWFSHSNQFFNSTLIAEESFTGGVFETKMLEDTDDNLKTTSAIVSFPVQASGSPKKMTMYIGPNDFENLRQYKVELEDIIPFGQSIFGTINRWVIRPIFNFLIAFIGSHGIVILLLTLLVKLALFPLSYKMLHSQAKMSALKPSLAGLREKYKDDMQKQQMETMKVYREYGVNPLGGCFPVLLQMPVWFALYRFFPASIEFRQASFLWATDLSSYDVFFNLPFDIPYFGAHVSMLTLLWAASTIAYTYYNMQNMDMANMNPALKYMQYIMPVMFLVFFNSYASGLTLYLLYSNLLNIGQTLGAKKWLFDENKIMAELNKNKEKPKKEGGFAARLEQAMKEQQKLAESRKNQASANIAAKKKNK
jgi:YidC/Oxa1 family membrane protein insertase